MESNINYQIAKDYVDYWSLSYEQLNKYKKILEEIFVFNGCIALETMYLKILKYLWVNMVKKQKSN